ncbi:hypothetical protein LGQ02_04555 [Bacillus shivajii]|uniref:hypothetical protein n=1 Tax=Bacillus shivajii TaxID=1983719 RepID=UPI001CFB0951|nr:hypothetical protein [Bacillus shivajii]UCZ54059.1 hypothetical protein LGQ02_04555 [Bacillus shivajii]
MENDQQAKKWVVRGLIAGTVAGVAYVAANKSTRSKVISSAECISNQTKHWITVLNENREPLVEKVRQSSEKITTVVENASDDVEKIVESSLHMKEHAKDLISALEETKNEFQSFASQMTQIDSEQLENETALLPESKNE